MWRDVVEQHPHGHGWFLGEETGHQLVDAIVERQLTASDGIEHERRGDRLGDARDAEPTLYYADRNDRLQRSWECDPSVHVADLLEEIDNDPTCIFWG